MSKKKGQSTLEYIIVVAMIIAAIIAFASASGTGFKARINQSMEHVTDEMTNVVNRLQY
jgi:hypothetical protein